MKIAVLVGSISDVSQNKKLAQFLKNQFKDDFQMDILDLKEIPMYNQDIELSPPEVIKNYRKTISQADGLIFITPEYNYSIPGVLKNAIDWFSRVEFVLKGKPTLIMGGSGGNMGTIRAQAHLRDILAAPTIKALVMPGNEILISRIQDIFDENNNLTDEGTVNFISGVMDKFKIWIEDTKDIRIDEI